MNARFGFGEMEQGWGTWWTIDKPSQTHPCASSPRAWTPLCSRLAWVGCREQNPQWSCRTCHVTVGRPRLPGRKADQHSPVQWREEGKEKEGLRRVAAGHKLVRKVRVSEGALLRVSRSRCLALGQKLQRWFWAVHGQWAALCHREWNHDSSCSCDSYYSNKY